MILILEHRW